MWSVLFTTCLAMTTLFFSTGGYKGIVPIQSTRSDVEKQFGLPTDPQTQSYSFKDETVTFHYSKYGCNAPQAVKGWPEAPSEGWNVPPDTVLSIIVTLREQVPLRSLGIDQSGFVRVRGDSDTPTHFAYLNREAGWIIDLNGDGSSETVRGFIYQPEAKYDNLRCPKRQS